MLPTNKLIYSAVTTASSANSADQQLDFIYGYSIVLAVTDQAPAVTNFVAANVTPAADTITITAHGYLTGLKVALSGTNLPTGLSATNYYVIKVDADTIKLATSQANAVAGTAVDITGAGTTADAALTPAALAGTAKLQASTDPTGTASPNYVDVPSSSQNITASGNLYFSQADVFYNHMRVVTAVTAGQVSLTAYLNAKGA